MTKDFIDAIMELNLPAKHNAVFRKILRPLCRKLVFNKYISVFVKCRLRTRRTGLILCVLIVLFFYFR